MGVNFCPNLCLLETKLCCNLTLKANFFDSFGKKKLSLLTNPKKSCHQNFSRNSLGPIKIIMIYCCIFSTKKLIKEKNCDHFFFYNPSYPRANNYPTFFTKHMAYNINFCEGKLEAAPARF